MANSLKKKIIGLNRAKLEFWRPLKKCSLRSKSAWKRSSNQNGVYLLREDSLWAEGGDESSSKTFASKLFIVDPSDLKTQHIIFDSPPINELDCLNCIWDITSKTTLSPGSLNNLSVCSADLIQAIIDSDYFIKQVTKCLEEKAKSTEAKLAEEAKATQWRMDVQLSAEQEFLKSCSPSDYLKKTLFPHLIPGLNAIEKERPNDPLAFLALHLLEHKDSINEMHELTK